MPIKGLSETIRLSRLGKIHLGVKVTNAQGVEYPKAVDYFVCPPEVRAVYGEKPNVLSDVFFPSDNPSEFASQFYRAYSKSRGLVCKGDGDQANRLMDTDAFEKDGDQAIAGAEAKRTHWRDLPCPGKDCEYYQRGNCRELMNLQFFLPRVEGLGVWQIDTSSVNAIIEANSAFTYALRMFGRITAVPFSLVLEPREKSPEGRKKTVYIVEVRLPNISLHELAQRVIGAEKPMAMLLPPADVERPDLLYPEPAEREAQQEAEKQVGPQASVASVPAAPPVAPIGPVATTQAAPIPVTPTRPTKAADEPTRFFLICREHFGKTPGEALKDLGVISFSALKDPQQALTDLALRTGKPVPKWEK